VRNLNTVVSYALRAAVSLHAGYPAWEYLYPSDPIPGQSVGLWMTAGFTALIAILLIADWSTRKAQSRRYAKIIDSAIGIGWLIAIGALVIRSLVTGMP
jgi:hypothetical protein